MLEEGREAEHIGPRCPVIPLTPLHGRCSGTWCTNISQQLQGKTSERAISRLLSALPCWANQSSLRTSISSTDCNKARMDPRNCPHHPTPPPWVYHKPLELSKPKGGPCSHPHHEPAAGPFPKPSQGALPTQPPSGHSSGATVHRAVRGMRLPSAPASAGIMYAPHRAPVTQSQPVCGGRDSP